MNIPDIPLGWLPVADAVAKTTVILFAAMVASVLLRSASAALRHLVWTLALSSALVLPIASFALPKWQLPLLTITTSSNAASAPVATADGAITATDTVAAPGLPPKGGSHDVRESRGGSHEVRKNTGGSHESETGTAPQPATRASIFEGFSGQQMLAGIWM